MPLDPSIALQGRRVALEYDPVGGQVHLAQLAGLQQQRQLGSLKLLGEQQGLQEDLDTRQVLARHAATIGTPEGDRAYLRELAEVNPGAYLKQRKAVGEEQYRAGVLDVRQQDARLKHLGIVQEQVAGAFAGVNDQPSFERAMALALPVYNTLPESKGRPLEAFLGTTYDPAKVDQFRALMRTAQERIAMVRDLRERETQQGIQGRHEEDLALQYKIFGLNTSRLASEEQRAAAQRLFEERRLASEERRAGATQGLKEAEYHAARREFQQNLTEKERERQGKREERYAEVRRDVDKDRLTKINVKAQTADEMTPLIAEYERLRSLGTYDLNPVVKRAVELYQKEGVTTGYDPKVLANTATLMQVGAAMLNTSTNLAKQGVTDADAAIIKRAIGDLTEFRPTVSVDASLTSLKRRLLKAQSQADIANRHYEQFNRLPEFTPGALRKSVMDAAKAKGVTVTPAEVDDVLREKGLLD